MIATRGTPVTRPDWWDTFIGHVRTNGGKIADAMRSIGMHHQAHAPYVTMSPELKAQLDEAVRTGRLAPKHELVERILEKFAAGMSLAEAAGTEGIRSARIHLLLNETGLLEKYERLRDEQRSRTKDYRSGVEFLRRELDNDRTSTDDGVALSYIGILRDVVDVVDRDWAEVQKLGGVHLRNEILRTIGQAFEGEEGFPPFLRWPEEV